MFTIRDHVIQRGLAAGVVLLAASVFVSAVPAASGERGGRPFLTGTYASARLSGADVVRLPGSASMPLLRGSATAIGSLGTTARGRGLGIDTDVAEWNRAELRVVLENARPAAARAAVRAAGGRVERRWGTLVQALVPADRVSALSRSAAVDNVRLPFRARELAVDGEEAAASFAAAWHRSGLTGKGVKIAVIDAGFSGLAERQAGGELPANVVTQDLCRGEFASASEHGTAVAEIVHEMAPAARLYLVCIDTEVDLAAAVAYARSQGVHVINHSMGWFGPSRGDGSGDIGDIAQFARANGMLWVNAAGNEAETHWAGTYRAGAYGFHDWGGGDLGNSFVWPNGQVVCGFLKWDEWPNAVSDFDFGIFLAGENELLIASVGDQSGSQPPYEGLCARQTSGRHLTVFWAIHGYRVQSAPRLELFSLSPPLEYATAAGSIVDPATSPASLAVGALCWQTRELARYSSQGPTIDGRVKPDLVGHDSVSSATYGAFSSCPSAFAGTSASSPEVAGAAALVKQAYPAFGPAELEAYLKRHALDLAPAGPDNATGWGELRLPKPPDVTAPTVRALPSRGRSGSAVRLVARVSDDSGEARLVGQVLRNGRVVATLRNGFVKTSGPTAVALVWKAPANASGAHRYCARASDRAGNASARSCARIALG